jgi:hypothetical protein
MGVFDKFRRKEDKEETAAQPIKTAGGWSKSEEPAASSIATSTPEERIKYYDEKIRAREQEAKAKKKEAEYKKMEFESSTTGRVVGALKNFGTDTVKESRRMPSRRMTKTERKAYRKQSASRPYGYSSGMTSRSSALFGSGDITTGRENPVEANMRRMFSEPAARGRSPMGDGFGVGGKQPKLSKELRKLMGV